MSENEKAGLYIHIPFCKSKCPYCDFYSVRYDADAAAEYADRVILEMKKYCGAFDTVYFGGGTPSVIEPELIGEILDAARSSFDIDKNAEITIECNPSCASESAFEKYVSYGVNRVSIGMQSAVDSERRALGRTAGADKVAAAVGAAKRAGISNISLDVMLGTPGQSLKSLDETFDFISCADVTHISAYMLKIEEGTCFYEMRDRLALPDDDAVGDMYLKTVSRLASLGFEQYEISNFARRGFESRHNLKYWHLAQYLGLGKSAHSFWQGKRFYCDASFNVVPDGTGGSDDEKIMLGLRLNEGISVSLLKNDNYKKFIQLGLMEESGGKISLTPRGMLVSNVIIGELL